ncbi:MAG: insulinase family protein [Lachnospiraceae bacterium]|nr:insulinase family protein [Lachnospiraceae bacterium]
MNFPESYELILEKDVEELSAHGAVLTHKKTGAHVFLLENEDTNKVYDIGFRTPPSDDCGIPHILEHSVLCGSEKYPVRDPFVELEKGSMNTFMNAMTYAEKTVYPIASVNDRDFENLMSVYTDAVFRPNILRNDKIFRQEGWHYEMAAPDQELRLSGVVYNEMRGAFSDPDSVLDRYIKRSLFPDTPYVYDSGGLPDAIPELDYKRLCAFHSRYYHPSNAYVYLYGKMDFYERLDWLDKEYLCHYEKIDPESLFPEQEPFTEVRDVTGTYGISEDEDDSLAIFSYAKAVGGLMDPHELLAFDVIAYALLNAPGAPLRKALQTAGIGTEIYGGYDSSFRVPVFSVTARDAKSAGFGRFIEIIEAELGKAAEGGIPEKTLLAGINSLEFLVREADFGRFPKGLAYGFQAFDTWIYDERSPMLHLTYNESFRFLKEMVGTPYYTGLIRDRILLNTHGVRICLTPERGMADREDRELSERLLALKNSLSPEALDWIVKDTEELRLWQEAPESEEALSSIPHLSLSDIRKDADPLKNELMDFSGVPGLLHRMNTSGISYVDLLFDLSGIPDEDYPLVSLMRSLLTQMDTEHYTYQDLNDEIGLYTGGIGSDMSIYRVRAGKPGIGAKFAVRGKAVTENTEELVRLFREVIFHTDFSDTVRLREIVSEIRTQYRDSMVSSGHSTAMKRMLSYASQEALLDEQVNGVDFYRYIEDLAEHFDERKDALVKALRGLSLRIFRKGQLLVSLTAEEDGCLALQETISGLLPEMPEEKLPAVPRTLVPARKNEGFMTSSMVQYVAMGGSFTEKGYAYSGAYRVLRTLLGYDYLWVNIRTKQNAYGCMSYFNRNGETAFVSYRDPLIRETLDVFRGIPAYLEALSLPEEEIERYIIGTLSESDAPTTPSVLGRRSLNAYLTGVTDDDIRKDREEVLSCTLEDIKALAVPLRAVLSDELYTVVGGTDMIRSCEELFGSTEPLSGEPEGAGPFSGEQDGE